jgi:hypothetical protein
MAETRVSAYMLSMKVGGKLIKGLETTGLSGKASFQEVLIKSANGTKEKEFDTADWTLKFSGKTIERDGTESSTHEDFETLREAMNSGAAVSFVYGRLAAGEKIVSGTCVITDWSEDAGSEKTMGSWSGSAEVSSTRSFTTFSDYGPEKVTNGTFTSNINGWTNYSGHPWDTAESSGGQLHLVSNGVQETGALCSLYQSLSLLAGHVYRIRFDVTQLGSNGIILCIEKPALGSAAGYNKGCSITESVDTEFTCLVDDPVINIYTSAPTAAEFNFDNISIQEVL